MKRLQLLSFFVLPGLILAAYGTGKNIEKRMLLKEYVFCQCVLFASNDSLLTKDISKGIYLGTARYDADV